MTARTSMPLLHSVMNRAADHMIPFQVSIEMTYRCNLSCKHCYVDMPSEDELSVAELKHILDQLAEAGTMYLLLTGGEALLRPDLFDIANYAKKRGFLVTLLTNGTLVTAEAARELKRLGPLSVGISLHGATANTHDGITRRQGSFFSTLRAVMLLKSLGVPVSLQTLVMDSNIHEVDAIKALVRKIGIDHHFGYEFLPAKSGSLAPYQHEADYAELRHCLDGDPANQDAVCSGEKGICKAGRGICSISPTGDVFPCLLMPMKVGNLRRETFADIWHARPSPALAHLRSITWQDFSGCQDCELARFCRRCMGVALAETGEPTRPAPSACRYAALKSKVLERKGVVA